MSRLNLPSFPSMILLLTAAVALGACDDQASGERESATAPSGGGKADDGSELGCGPQDATARDPGLCEIGIGAAWDGQACVALSGCGCDGEDCQDLYPSLEACESAYVGCYDDGDQKSTDDPNDPFDTPWRLAFCAWEDHQWMHEQGITSAWVDDGQLYVESIDSCYLPEEMGLCAALNDEDEVVLTMVGRGNQRSSMYDSEQDCLDSGRVGTDRMSFDLAPLLELGPLKWVRVTGWDAPVAIAED